MSGRCSPAASARSSWDLLAPRMLIIREGCSRCQWAWNGGHPTGNASRLQCPVNSAAGQEKQAQIPAAEVPIILPMAESEAAQSPEAFEPNRKQPRWHAKFFCGVQGSENPVCHVPALAFPVPTCSQHVNYVGAPESALVEAVPAQHRRRPATFHRACVGRSSTRMYAAPRGSRILDLGPLELEFLHKLIKKPWHQMT